jgi:hypothetical protein
MLLRPHQEALCCIVNVCLLLSLNRKTEKPRSLIQVPDTTASERNPEHHFLEPKHLCKSPRVSVQANEHANTAAATTSTTPALPNNNDITISTTTAHGDNTC